MKNLLFTLIIAAVALVVGFVTSSYFDIFNRRPTVEQEGTVLLEKIKTVSKLVTIEGYFSEVWKHEVINKNTWFTFWDKKAILKVKGKVSVGYDLEQMKVETFPNEKIVRISNLPSPQIISVDHDLEYFNIQEGVFTSFTTKELTKLNQVAKDTLIAVAKRSQLLETAKEKGNDVITLIELISKDAGWKVEYNNAKPLPAAPKKENGLQGFQPTDKDSFTVASPDASKALEDEAHLLEGFRQLAG